jgi:hypothetical protein
MMFMDRQYQREMTLPEYCERYAPNVPAHLMLLEMLADGSFDAVATSVSFMTGIVRIIEAEMVRYPTEHITDWRRVISNARPVSVIEQTPSAPKRPSIPSVAPTLASPKPPVPAVAITMHMPSSPIARVVEVAPVVRSPLPNMSTDIPEFHPRRDKLANNIFGYTGETLRDWLRENDLNVLNGAARLGLPFGRRYLSNILQGERRLQDNAAEVFHRHLMADKGIHYEHNQYGYTAATLGAWFRGSNLSYYDAAEVLGHPWRSSIVQAAIGLNSPLSMAQAIALHHQLIIAAKKYE